MTNPMSQASLPGAAAAAADSNAPDGDRVDEPTAGALDPGAGADHDSDGVPVGDADVAADARRARADGE